jgi:hypothetical protein
MDEEAYSERGQRGGGEGEGEEAVDDRIRLTKDASLHADELHHRQQQPPDTPTERAHLDRDGDGDRDVKGSGKKVLGITAQRSSALIGSQDTRAHDWTLIDLMI